LKNYKIEVVVDVRRFPTSKWEQFKLENLKKSLDEEGMEYVHIPSLGGYRNKGYKNYMQSEAWKKGYELLKKIAIERKTAFMCAEQYPFRCHRRKIAMALHGEGWEVVHILNDEKWIEKRSYALR
jgi:uncharacterized protein (DUF488 family)